MSASDAMQTTFTGDGPTTHVTIARDLAEADHGDRFDSDQSFARWIDANNDRLYAAAATKRATKTLYESISLTLDDLSRLAAHATIDVPIGIAAEDEADEARVIAIGEPVETSDPLFVGPLAAVVEHVLARDIAYRSSVAIWTPSRLYGEDEFEQMRFVPADRR